MPSARRLLSVIFGACALLAAGGALMGQGPVQPPVTTYLQAWPLSITPNEIAPDPVTGNMAVVDAGNSVIQLLRPGGTPLGQIRGLHDPRSAAFTPSGILLVGEAGMGSVKGYTLAGRVVLTLGSPSGEFLTPNDIAIHPDGTLAYVVDSAAHTVKVYSLLDGSFQYAFGSQGAGDGELDFPISVTVAAATGEVFVGDSRNRRIAVFDAASGSFLRNIGVAGGGSGEISFVGGLHIDPNQRLYAAESLGGFVQVYDPFGGFMMQIGDHGVGPALLRSPKGLAVDKFNRLLVTSFLDRKIEVWGLDQFENPVDQDLVANVTAIPLRLASRRGLISVAINVPGIDPTLLDPDSVRLNGVVRPVQGFSILGPRLVVRFLSADVRSAVPPGVSGRITLLLTGKTFQGLRFRGDLQVIAGTGQRITGTRRTRFQVPWRDQQ